MKKNFRHDVMSLAHRIFNLAQMSWSIALKKAWLIVKLVTKMHKGVASFQYQKTDGSIRSAQGTLLKSITDLLVNGNGKSNDKTIAYFDIEKQAFRCFKIENILTIA